MGEILRRARNLIGLSIRDLAARSKVSSSQILRVESGEFDIMLSTLLKLTRHLGVPAGLVLEQSAIPNPGYYAKLIGPGEVAALLEPIPAAERPRNARTRLVLFSAKSAAALSCLLHSSHANRLVSSIKFPVQAMRDAFTEFAEEIDKISTEDRISLQRELESEPEELLARLELLTPRIAAEFLMTIEDHADLQPNFFELL